MLKAAYHPPHGRRLNGQRPFGGILRETEQAPEPFHRVRVESMNLSMGGGPNQNQQKKGVDWSCGQKLCTRNFFISNLAVSLPVPVPEVLLLHCRVHAQKPTSGFAAEGSGGAGRGEESQSARCNLPREQFSAKDVTCTFPRHASRAPSASITPNCGQDRD